MVRFEEILAKDKAIAVVGLGYVGLPLALHLGRHFRVIGFDISRSRVAELAAGRDRTREADEAELKRGTVAFTCRPEALKEASLIIVAVPTPIDRHRRPDLHPVLSATRTVGSNLAAGSVVVYESTVYPGLTEEECVPLLEECSGLICGRGFKVGYSPERINPGDKQHTLETIVKVVAGQDEATTELLAQVYGAVVKAGIHRAASIRVAEAAKVIENTQRDLNIALMNELSLIFDEMGIDTLDVLEAAGTKWNFLNFRPGLVGGHCIGVDPYYLTFKAESLGLHPQVILAGRRINDAIGKRVAEVVVRRLIQAKCAVSGARVAVLGLTFKENVPDLRNTRVVDIIHELSAFGVEVLVHDPQADPAEAGHEYGLSLTGLEDLHELDGIVLAVPHEEYRSLPLDDLRARCRCDRPVLADVKGTCGRTVAEQAGFSYWRL